MQPSREDREDSGSSRTECIFESLPSRLGEGTHYSLHARIEQISVHGFVGGAPCCCVKGSSPAAEQSHSDALQLELSVQFGVVCRS